MNAHQKFPQVSDRAIAGSLVKTVDGREVHAFLEARRDYTNWIKDRIRKYGFVEGVDYLLTEIGEQHPSGTKYRTEYFLTISMGKELGMVDRSAKGREIRKYFLSIEENSIAQRRPMTPAEMFMQNAELLLNIERQNMEIRQHLQTQDARIEKVERTAPLTTKPQSSETKTEVKSRIGKQYGLPAWVIDAVLTTSPLRLPVFGMVKNNNENAQGSSYAVYQIVDVTKLFKRFVREYQPATATTSTHPYIDGRFKLTRRE